MTVSFGFYNSVTGDRTYNAIQMSSIFDGIIQDGVLETVGNALMVIENTGMGIYVQSGRAWFNHTWTYNDANLSLTVPTAHATLPRIDLVILEVDGNTGVRANDIKILQGTAASTPVEPTLTQTDPKYQYPLAAIYVAAGVTSIVQANITNKIGTSECPFVTGPLEGMSADALLAQWDGEFHDWFDNLVDQLTGVQVTNLQNQINTIVGDSNPPVTDILTLKDHDHSDGQGAILTADSLADGIIDYTKMVTRERRLEFSALEGYASGAASKIIRTEGGVVVSMPPSGTSVLTWQIKLPTGWIDSITSGWHILWTVNNGGTGIVNYEVYLRYVNLLSNMSSYTSVKSIGSIISPGPNIKLQRQQLFGEQSLLPLSSNGYSLWLTFKRMGDSDTFVNNLEVVGLFIEYTHDM
ncbi:MAG: hypothetical protein FK734_11120 [Asgard group archaeon]|nr:hypothetical protein [Asgard group archaeon]